MKENMRQVLGGVFTALIGIIIIPLFVIASILGMVFKIFASIYNKYLEVKKYSERKVKRKLYTQIKKILSKEKEIYLCKDFWISPDEQSSYTTLKYLFTKNKDTFVYKKGSDRYLYNYYDFNAHKEDFVCKWIEEIRNLNGSGIVVEETLVENYLDESEKKSVLKITCSQK